MQIELSLDEVKQIQPGLMALAALTEEKKHNVPFELEWNTIQWLTETEPLLKQYDKIITNAMEEFGEKIYAKESVLNEMTTVKNYDEEGKEKSVLWRMVVTDDKKEAYNKKIDEANAHKEKIGKVNYFKLSDLKNLKVSANVKKSLMPIINVDLKEIEADETV